jgi:hypothetical protein
MVKNIVKNSAKVMVLIKGVYHCGKIGDRLLFPQFNDLMADPHWLKLRELQPSADFAP